MIRTRRDPFALAVYLLRHGHPLPVDLQATLIEYGFDLYAIEDKYANY